MSADRSARIARSPSPAARSTYALPVASSGNSGCRALRDCVLQRCSTVSATVGRSASNQTSLPAGALKKRGSIDRCTFQIAMPTISANNAATPRSATEKPETRTAQPSHGRRTPRPRRAEVRSRGRTPQQLLPTPCHRSSDKLRYPSAVSGWAAYLLHAIGVGFALAILRGAHRLPTPRRPWTEIVAALAIGCGLLALTSGPLLIDFFKAYLYAGDAAWSNPSTMYECTRGQCFVNIPIVALFFVPLAALGSMTAGVLFSAVGALLLVAAVRRMATGAMAHTIIWIVILSGPMYYSYESATRRICCCCR